MDVTKGTREARVRFMTQEFQIESTDRGAPFASVDRSARRRTWRIYLLSGSRFVHPVRGRFMIFGAGSQNFVSCHFSLNPSLGATDS
jgi:hypothetical protein